MLGLGGYLPMRQSPTRNVTVVDLSVIPWMTLPSFDAWVLRLENLETEPVGLIEQLLVVISSRYVCAYCNSFSEIQSKSSNGWGLSIILGSRKEQKLP